MVGLTSRCNRREPGPELRYFPNQQNLDSWIQNPFKKCLFLPFPILCWPELLSFEENKKGGVVVHGDRAAESCPASGWGWERAGRESFGSEEPSGRTRERTGAAGWGEAAWGRVSDLRRVLQSLQVLYCWRPQDGCWRKNGGGSRSLIWSLPRLPPSWKLWPGTQDSGRFCFSLEIRL